MNETRDVSNSLAGTPGESDGPAAVPDPSPSVTPMEVDPLASPVSCGAVEDARDVPSVRAPMDPRTLCRAVCAWFDAAVVRDPRDSACVTTSQFADEMDRFLLSKGLPAYDRSGLAGDRPQARGAHFNLISAIAASYGVVVSDFGDGLTLCRLLVRPPAGGYPFDPSPLPKPASFDDDGYFSAIARKELIQSRLAETSAVLDEEDLDRLECTDEEDAFESHLRRPHAFAHLCQFRVARRAYDRKRVPRPEWLDRTIAEMRRQVSWDYDESAKGKARTGFRTTDNLTDVLGWPSTAEDALPLQTSLEDAAGSGQDAVAVHASANASAVRASGSGKATRAEPFVGDLPSRLFARVPDARMSLSAFRHLYFERHLGWPASRRFTVPNEVVAAQLAARGIRLSGRKRGRDVTVDGPPAKNVKWVEGLALAPGVVVRESDVECDAGN
eukprot:jgi/Mesvir1/11356/Mv10256-RA.1